MFKLLNITILALFLLMNNFFLTTFAVAKSNYDKRLDKAHAKISQDYPQLSHISREDFQNMLSDNKSDIIVLDTRPLSEYRISHIEGAIQIDPDIKAQKLETLNLDGKTVIVYCSVGRRSSALANRLERAFTEIGAEKLLNLEGGLFGWHNEGRPLVNQDGETETIHPYNGFWGGRYLKHKNKTAYSSK